MTEVTKAYKEDLTRKSLQNAAVSRPYPQKQKKKPGHKSDVKFTVNAQDNGQRQVFTKPAATSGSAQGSSFSSKFKQKKSKKFQNKK